MIYTSYFSMMKWLNKEKCISISRFTPAKIDIRKFDLLAPSEELLKHFKQFHDIDYYINQYNAYLNRANPKKVYDYLDGSILLCYEKPSDFCHRHLVRKWFNDAGLECREINFKGDDVFGI